MCSIIGLAGSGMAAPLVVQGLRRMEYRGYDSAGVAVLEGGSILVRKGVGKVEEVNSSLGLELLPGSVAIGHTRWATHGGVTDYNAHPHLSSMGKVAVVHNGIVDNYEELKSALQDRGYTFKSETDTEVIANLLDLHFSATGTAEQALMRTLVQLKGKYAFAVIFQDGTLAAAREHEPLILGIASRGIYVSSDVLGFSGQTDRVIYLENREFAVASRGTVCLYDFKGTPVPHEVTTVAKEFGQADKGEFVHYTIKEIHEQPTTALAPITGSQKEIAELASMIREAKRVYFTACGTSFHAAQLGAHILFNRADVEARTVLSSEAKYRTLKYGPETLVVALSQSGETADVLEAVESAKDQGAKVAALVNAQTSSLARAAEVVVGLNCGPEVGVAATKSFTAQAVALYALAQQVSGERFQARLEQIPPAIKSVLGLEVQLRTLAHEMRGANDIYVLGAGGNYFSALEASLKLKELAYVHAEALPGGELKHGPLALIDDGTYVLIMNPQDETYEGTLASAHEVRSRGAKIVGISNVPSKTYDRWIKLPTVDGHLYPVVEVIPTQLLAYYLAVERNADPDYPRNLAKSVTVK